MALEEMKVEDQEPQEGVGLRGLVHWASMVAHCVELREEKERDPRNRETKNLESKTVDGEQTKQSVDLESKENESKKLGLKLVKESQKLETNEIKKKHSKDLNANLLDSSDIEVKEAEFIAGEPKKLEPIWLERAESVFGERVEKREGLLQELRKLVEQEKGLVVPQEEGFLLMFLRAGQMSPTMGFEVLKNYFNLRKSSPEYFKCSTDVEKIVRTVLSQKIHCMLPKRDKLGRRVYVFRPGRWDPAKIAFNDLFCAGYMLSELVVREERTQIAGLISITDATGFGFRHMRAIGMEDGKRIASFFNISFPLWLRQSHVLHAPRMFHVMFNMLRPFLSDEVKDNVVFHSGDLSSILEYFPGDLLPSDVGGQGSLGPLDNSKNAEELRAMGSFFTDIQNFGYT